MSSTFKNLLALIVAIMAVAGGYWLSQHMRSEPEISTTLSYGGGRMIDFTLPELDGKKHSLSEWSGKVIVLNFWATWCPPCREEIPMLIELQKQRGADGLQIIGVAIDNKTAVMLFRRSAEMNYPVLLSEDGGLDLLSRYGNSAGSLPFTVIIDRSGSIIVRKLGQLTRIELEGLLAPLLGRPGTLKNS